MSEDRRCSLCGCCRIQHKDGTWGACTFIGCKNPLYDYDREREAPPSTGPQLTGRRDYAEQEQNKASTQQNMAERGHDPSLRNERPVAPSNILCGLATHSEYCPDCARIATGFKTTQREAATSEGATPRDEMIRRELARMGSTIEALRARLAEVERELASAITSKSVWLDNFLLIVDLLAATNNRFEDAEARVEELEKFAQKVHAIRNDIVKRQSLGWSSHVYPLVAALKEIGLEYDEGAALQHGGEEKKS